MQRLIPPAVAILAIPMVCVWSAPATPTAATVVSGIVPNFCSARGRLVLAGNQATPIRFGTGLDLNSLAGQPKS